MLLGLKPGHACDLINSMPRDGPSLTVAAMNSSLTVATMNSFSNGSHHMSCHNAEGEAGARQVTGAKVGLQHNLGLGGACTVLGVRGVDRAHTRGMALRFTSLLHLKRCHA